VTTLFPYTTPSEFRRQIRAASPEPSAAANRNGGGVK
jgi:hypothetical protein